MDKLKSNDLNFLFLINKSTFLLDYIDIYYRKEILNDINRFIKNLNDTFAKQYFENEEKKKEKTFEILNKYFKNLIDDQILYLIDIYHKHEKGSYKDSKLLIQHIISAVKYFNKWGWFSDKERKRINCAIIEKLKEDKAAL